MCGSKFDDLRRQQSQRLMLLALSAEEESNAVLGLFDLFDGDDDDAGDDEIGTAHVGRGRGAPGYRRKRAKFYPHPDGSNVARDIIAMQDLIDGDEDYEARHKDWRMTYRVPWAAFPVCLAHPPVV